MSCNLKCTPVKAVTAFTRVLGQEERTKINALVVALNDLIDDVEVTYKSARSVGYFPRVFGEGAAVTTGTFHLGHMPQQGCFEKVLIGVDGAGAADAEFAIKKNGTAITTSNLTLSAGGLYVASTTFGTGLDDHAEGNLYTVEVVANGEATPGSSGDGVTGLTIGFVTRLTDTP